MADLEETLHALLSDPETMGQLQALASQLGLDGAAPSEDGEEAPGQTPSPPPFDLEEIGQMGRLLELFQTSQQTDPQADALIAALRPYLRPERQRKLDQAVRLAGLSRAQGPMKTSRRNILRDGGPPSPPCSAGKAAALPVCCKNWALGRWTAGTCF